MKAKRRIVFLFRLVVSTDNNTVWHFARASQRMRQSSNRNTSLAHTALHYHSKMAATGISKSARGPFSKAKKQQNRAREKTLAMRITFVDAF